LELQQKKLSKAEEVSVFSTNKFPLTKPFSEKFLKKVIAKDGPDDALKKSLNRLDRLSQLEAQMATVQLLRIATTIIHRTGRIADDVHGVDERVAGVDERVAGVDGRVAGVDERVAGVDERVAGVDERVAGVDERVAGVDERVAGVDERVASVNERVAGVDEHVAGVDDRVKDVDGRVKAVGDKLVTAFDGAQCIFNHSLKIV
jgi:archaellum component FlaC